MTTPKLPHHMRIAALQCNFEGGEENTLRIPEFWSECGFNTEQLFHPIGELYSAVFDKSKHENILHKYMEKSKEADVAIILYLNCHILLESQNHMLDEWGQTLSDGSYRKLYGTYYACCLNSSWMDYFSELIGDLAEYPIAGIFFDGPLNLSCHCPRCDAKFAETYKKPIAEATEKELAEFSLRTQIDAKRRFTERTKEINPQWISYFNEGVMHSSYSTEEMREALSYNDIIGTEGGFQFYGPPKQTDIWRCSVSARMAEALADGKPTVIFMAGDHKIWSWYLHTPAETKLCYASIIANGASVWYGIHCSTDSLSGATGQAIREMVGFDKQHDALYQNTKSVAKVAIFHSFETSKNYTSTGEETDLYSSDSKDTGCIGNYSESFNGAIATLFRSNIPFDIVTELNIGDIAKYSVVLAPTAACLSESTVKKFESYVSAGGCLIVDSEFGLYDEQMRRLEKPMSANLTGVDCEGYRRYSAHDYFTFTEKGLNLTNSDVKFIPAPLVALLIKPKEGTNVLAELCHPLAGRYAGKPAKGASPFIIEHEIGKGIVYYFAGTFFELYNTYSISHYRKLVETLTRRHANFDVELIGASESVEFTVRKDESSGKTIIHLMNYTGGMSRPINKVVPLTGLRLKVPAIINYARCLIENCELSINNGEIELPPLKEFEVITLSNAD